MTSSKNNLVRLAVMGNLDYPNEAVELLDEDPWLQAHVRGDDLLLVDAMHKLLHNRAWASCAIEFNKRAHQAFFELAQWMDRAGCNVWARNAAGQDAFDLAVECGCGELVAWMGTHHNRPDNLLGRWNGSETVPMSSNPDTVRALARLGFDPNATQSNGNTALHVARNAAMVQALMEVGADPFLTNERGQDVRAHWDDRLQVNGEERKAMDVALAQFVAVDPQREIREFPEVVKDQGITQAMHRLALAKIDIATARWKGFTLPELMVASALNHGLSEVPITGTVTLKEMTSWFKRCSSVLNHYKNNGGTIDDGIQSAFSILLQVENSVKSHCHSIHVNLYNTDNKKTRNHLLKYEKQFIEIIPQETRLLDEDGDYLDRAVAEGVIEVGSAIAKHLAMNSATIKPQESGAIKMLERSLMEHWDGQWNHHHGQYRGGLVSITGRYSLIERAADILSDTSPELNPKTAAMILGVLAINWRATSSNGMARELLLKMAEESLGSQEQMGYWRKDPLVAGSLALMEIMDKKIATTHFGEETVVGMERLATRMRAMAMRDDMQQVTPAAPGSRRGMGRL